MSKNDIYKLIAESQVRQVMQKQQQQSSLAQVQQEYEQWKAMQDIQKEYDAWLANQNKAANTGTKQSKPKQVEHSVKFMTAKERQEYAKKITADDPYESYERWYGSKDKDKSKDQSKNKIPTLESQDKQKTATRQQVDKNNLALPELGKPKSFMDLYTEQSLRSKPADNVAANSVDTNSESFNDLADRLVKSYKKRGIPKLTYAGNHWENPYESLSDEEKTTVRDYIQANKDNPNLSKDEKQILKAFTAIYKDAGNTDIDTSNVYNNTMSDAQKKINSFSGGFVGINKPLVDAIAKPLVNVLDKTLVPGLLNAVGGAEGFNNEINNKDSSYNQLFAKAQSDNPEWYEAGRSAGQIYDYAVTAPFVGGAAESLGLTGKSAKVANQVFQAAQDLGIDIYPEAKRMLEEQGQINWGELAKRFGTDILQNVSMDAIPMLAGSNAMYEHLAKTVGNNADIFKTMDSSGAVKNIPDLLREGTDAAKAVNQIPTVESATDAYKGIDSYNITPAEAVADEATKVSKYLDPADKALSDINVTKTHTPEQIAAMQDYIKSTNKDIVDFVNNVNSKPANYHATLALSEDTPRAVDDIKRLTGIDTTGNRTVIDDKAVRHINNRHGINGAADQSMSDINSLARLEYVKNNYDEMFLGKSSKYRLKDGTKAPTVVYVKKIDGQYYAVESVSDAKSKTNYITSAFIGDADSIEKNIQKGSISRAEDVLNNTPSYTSKNEAGSTSFVNSNISAEGPNVNKNTVNNFIDEIIEKDADAANKLTINEINGKNGKKRYQIVYKNGDLSTPIEPGTTYETLEEANNKLKLNLQFFAEKKAAKAKAATPTPSTTEALWNELKAGEQTAGIDSGAAGAKITAETNEQGQRLSKLHSTLQNTEQLSDAEKKVFADKNGFWYDPDNERALANEAKAAVESDIEGIYNQYAGDNLDIGKLGGADAHKMFTASYDYSRMAQEALESGNEAAANLYNAKARNLMMNAREAATKGGQFNAAIAYYSKTPQGYIDKAYEVLDKQLVDFKSKNPKLADGIDALANDLASRLKDTDVEKILTGTDEAAKESLRKTVLDGMSEMINKSNNKYLKETFKNLSAADIDDIIASKYASDIARQLDMFSMGSFGVKPETVNKVLDIFAEAEKYGYNSKEYYKLEQEAFNLLANDLHNGKSLEDKLNTWRYFSMLSSPQTHIRNNLGNLTNAGLTGIRNNIAAAIEAAADRVVKATGGEGIQGGRTRSILNPLKDNDLIKAAAEDFDKNAYRQYKQAGNKWINASDELAKAGRTYKDNLPGKALEKLTGANADLLDYEDIIAGKAKYQTSLAGYLKANGADASIFNSTDEAAKELLAEGRQFALNQANEATFHQSNAFAELFSKGIHTAKNSNNPVIKGLGYVGDTVLPFVKTPSNILKQSFAYSPLEFMKVIGETSQWQKGAKTSAEYINDIANGVTGTMGLALGALLAHEGILYVGTGDKDLDSYNSKRGIKPMSIKVGDKYVSVGDLVPAAMSLVSGATAYEYMKQARNGDGSEAIDALTSGVYSMLETITDTTMLNGIADTLSAVRYAEGDNDVFGSLARTVAGNFANQFIPTLGSKMEKTIDDTKRTTYSDKQGKSAKYWDQETKYYQTKIPMLQEAGEKLEKSGIPSLQKVGDRLTLEPTIGAWGDVQKQQDYGLGVPGRVVNNFLNPLTTTTDSSDFVDDEIRRLYQSTGDSKVLEYGITASNNATVDGQKMTDKQWTAYQKGYGSLKHELAESLINSKVYESIEDPDKAEIYSTLNSFAKAYNQNKVADKDMSKANQEMAEAYKKGGAEAVINMATGKAMLSENNIRSNSAVGKAVSEATAKGDIEQANKIIEDTSTLADYGLTAAGPQATYQKAQQVIPSLTAKQFATTYKKIDADGNNGIKQDEIIDYLNETHASQSEGQKIWNAYGNDTWKKIPSLNDGVWTKKAK